MSIDGTKAKLKWYKCFRSPTILGFFGMTLKNDEINYFMTIDMTLFVGVD